MDKKAFWSDAAVQKIAPSMTCGSHEASGGVVASTQGTCLTCLYNVENKCHCAVISNLRMASKNAAPSVIAEGLFL